MSLGHVSDEAVVKITIVTGGQSGVDRGAHLGALSMGWTVDGYVPHDCRDENGPIPDTIVNDLRVCPMRGLYTRTLRNVDMSDAVICVVPDSTKPYHSPGTTTTMRYARRISKPRAVVTGTTGWRTAIELSPLVRAMSWPRAELKLMIAGPRFSLWPEGMPLAGMFVRELHRFIARALAVPKW